MYIVWGPMVELDSHNRSTVLRLTLKFCKNSYSSKKTLQHTQEIPCGHTYEVVYIISSKRPRNDPCPEYDSDLLG